MSGSEREPDQPDPAPPVPAEQVPIPGGEPGAGGERRSCGPWSLLIGVGCLFFVVMLGLAATWILPTVADKLVRAQRRQALAELRTIREAIEEFRLSAGGADPVDLEELVREGLVEQRKLVDPWGRAYLYEPATDESPINLCSLGRDGEPGGEGPDEDLVVSR